MLISKRRSLCVLNLRSKCLVYLSTLVSILFLNAFGPLISCRAASNAVWPIYTEADEQPIQPDFNSYLLQEAICPLSFDCALPFEALFDGQCVVLTPGLLSCGARHSFTARLHRPLDSDCLFYGWAVCAKTPELRSMFDEDHEPLRATFGVRVCSTLPIE